MSIVTVFLVVVLVAIAFLIGLWVGFKKALSIGVRAGMELGRDITKNPENYANMDGATIAARRDYYIQREIESERK